MSNRQIIIAFIDPHKFNSLLNEKAKEIGFYAYGEEGQHIYLGENKWVVIVDQQGTATVLKSIDGNSMSQASIILVPDALKLNYIPEFPFKILIHSITKDSYPHHFEHLKKSTNCKACYQDMEHPDTIYGKIANFIMQDSNITYQEIWDAIPEFDFELEAKLELLHNCLHHESIPDQLSPLLTNYQGDFNTFKRSVLNKTLFDEDYVKALRIFRIALLGS
jgi:hypothetical protein